MRYSTQLQGTWNDLGADEMKMIIFKSLPTTWQVNYKRSQTPIQRASIEDIMIFMSQEKEFVDSHRKQSTKWQDRQGDSRGQGQGRDQGQGCGRGCENGRQGQGDHEKKRCTQHGGEHLWRECLENWQSDAYKRAHGKGQGQGRGRDGCGDQSYHTQ